MSYEQSPSRHMVSTPPVNNQGLDLKQRLEDLLQDTKAEFNNAFSFRTSYQNAQNPILSLPDFGVIGLPLNPREAEALKSYHGTLPTPVEGDAEADTEVLCETWEINAAQIAIHNATWEIFMSGIRLDICRAFGDQWNSNKYRCELRRLMLRGPGASIYSRSITSLENTVARLLVLLPSEFSGGQLTFSHHGLGTTYDSHSRKLSETVALAWFTDVSFEIAPVTSGYQLGLWYDIVYVNTGAPLPVFRPSALMGNLDELLKAWNEDTTQESPEKILYLLEGKYAQKDLCFEALKCGDKAKAALLRMLGHKYHFGIGLLNVKCHQFGEEGVSDPKDHGYDSDYTGSEFDEMDQDLWVTHFADLDGNQISKELEYEEGKETIPAQFGKEMMKGSHDYGDKKGYLRHYGPRWVERGYNRTALVLWPARNNLLVRYSGSAGFSRACNEVQGITSTTPSPPEYELVEMLASRYPSSCYRGRAIKAVCEAACRWKDAKLWNRMFIGNRGCLELSQITDELKFHAVEVFGFYAVEPSFTLLIESEASSDAARFNFLDAFDTWISSSQNASHLGTSLNEVKTWIEAHRQTVMKSLRFSELGRSQFEEEAKVLIRTAKRYSGIDTLKEIFLPQLLDMADGEFLRYFALAVQRNQEFGSATPALSHTLLKAAIAKADFFNDNVITYPREERYVPIKRHIDACHQLGFYDLVESVLQRMLHVANLPEEELHDAVGSVLIPLVTFLLHNGDPVSAGKLIPQFQEVQTTVVSVYLNQLGRDIDSSHVSSVIEATVVGNDASLFASMVVPRLESMDISEEGLCGIAKELFRQLGSLGFPNGYTGRTMEDIVASFAGRYINSTNIEGKEYIIEALDWCVDLLPKIDLRQRLLQRVLDPNKTDVRYIVSVLVPLVRELTWWGKKRNCLDFLAPTFQKIMTLWIDKVFLPIPQMNRKEINVNGVSMLSSISTDRDTLTRLLGPQYNRIMTILRAVPSVRSSTSGSSSKTRADGKMRRMRPY